MNDGEERNAASQERDGASGDFVQGRTSGQYPQSAADAISPGPSFERDRQRWLDVVMYDVQLDPSARVVGWHLARLVNRKRGYAWPDQRTLAGLVGLSRRRLQELLDVLEAGGYSTRSHMGRKCQYRLLLQQSAGSEPHAQSAHLSAHVDELVDEEPAHHSAPIDRSSAHSTAPHLRTPVRTESTDDESDEADLSETRARPRAEWDGAGKLFRDLASAPALPAKARQPRRSDLPTPQELGDFDDWYAGYPRREGRKDALRAYVVAVRRGVPPELLLGRRDAYAACVRQQARAVRHIALPVTWLNGERWTDELPTGSDPHDRRRGGRPSVTQLVLRRQGREVLQ